jgi:hypothetical protein
MGIKAVCNLTECVRQRGEYMEILLRLRNGETTENDWKTLMENCTNNYLTPEKIARFHSSETIWLFNTNKENHIHNIKQLKSLLKPIILIKAEHDCVSSMGKTPDAAKKLSSTLYLAIDAKIMLLWNVNLSAGLVNGSTGVIKDFIYAEGKKAPDLPTYIVIEFDDYFGPKYFSKPGQEKWVPIEPEIAKWGGQSEEDHFRKQFPITLAYALTVWKCQGLTIKGLVAVELGDSEKEHGLTFVALSRATEMTNVYLVNGCSFTRLTKIKDGPKIKVRLPEDGRLTINGDETKLFYGHT